MDVSQLSNLFPTALTAISCGFIAVRFMKGGWTRHPQHLAAAICGAVFATGLFAGGSRASPDDYLTSIVAGLAGAAVAILLLNRLFAAGPREE